MSCNGCRVLRKGCSENCILRPCLQLIETAEAQGHATVFVSKFFGRAGLMSFISAVPENQRAALFQSLLFEAAGRTVNPVNGAVGLLWTGNWHVCQAAVESVLRGDALSPIPDLMAAAITPDDASESTGILLKRRRCGDGPTQISELDLSLTPSIPVIKRVRSPSMNSEESVATSCGDVAFPSEVKLLNLFN